LNPVWDEVFEFPVYYPDLAILHMTVKDDNNTGVDEQLGSFALPFISIQPGTEKKLILKFE
jgi:Ca2+-dependent lipid-binding protein